jgi:hypothetical protein
MLPADAVTALEREWELETGFLGQLREGKFDQKAYIRLRELLSSVDTSATAIDGRFVSLTWYMPLFVTWQRERCADAGCDMKVFGRALDEITNFVQHLLGTP